VQPTVELAKRFSKQRIDPMIEDSPRLRERVAPARTRDSGNTVLMKEFPGGVLVMTGANSAVGLRSMPARYLFLDEVDAYPGDVGDEGDPVTLAEARTRTFSYLAKTFLVSTPRLKGTSVIAREYERSDQRRYFVPCPYCGTEQVLVFDRLRYDRASLNEVHYECEHCNELIAEHAKTDMLARGRWLATSQSDDPHMRGYHLSALYSPVGWLSWLTIARQWENEASKSVDARKGFINTILGEAYEEEANPIPEWERLYERRESWPHGMVPERGLFLTAGADVQGDRIEVDVWAWGRQLESWLVEHLTIAGDPGHATTWAAMTTLIGRTWEHASGRRMALQRIAVDTGAYTQSVYQWARGQDRATVLPVKGVPAYDRTVPVNGPTRIEVMQNGTRLKSGLNLWTVSVSFFKRELYKQLELARPTDEERAAGLRYPAGYVHIPDAVSDEWVKQLVSEQQVIIRERGGFKLRTEWRQLRPRNEALDMRVYARAAVWLAGADGWRESKWRDLEEQLGLKTEATARVEQRNIDQPVAQPPVVHSPVSEAPPGAPGASADLGGMIRRRSGRRMVRF
jgi:phage terminase large subunit GpA-like protein